MCYTLYNRNYESAYFLEILYYLTTIWIGYDLTCSEMSTRNGLHEVHDILIEKGWTPVITSIFCYILSLQFVWVFVFLDVIKYDKPKETDTNIKGNSPVHLYLVILMKLMKNVFRVKIILKCLRLIKQTIVGFC